jgi:hypothetical protein
MPHGLRPEAEQPRTNHVGRQRIGARDHQTRFDGTSAQWSRADHRRMSHGNRDVDRKTLSEYTGEGRTKLSRHKPILPGRKQVFRREEDRHAIGDVTGRFGGGRRATAATNGDARRTTHSRGP